MFDNSGRDYIEAVAGLWCASLGFGSERLAKVAYEQMRELGYYHLYRHRSNEPAIELAEKLLKIAPVPMARVVFQCSGSEANDTADQARLVLLGRGRTAAAHQDHRAPDGLSRQHLRRGEPLRQARHACGLRLAVRAVQAHRIPALLPPPRGGRERGGVLDAHGRSARELIAGGRARHHRRIFRRAGDGSGRRDHSAAKATSRRSRRSCASTTSCSSPTR